MNTNQSAVNLLREKRARIAASITAAAGALEDVATAAAVATAASGEAPPDYAPDASRRGHNLDVLQLAQSEVDAEIADALHTAQLAAAKARGMLLQPAERALADQLAQRVALLTAATRAITPGVNGVSDIPDNFLPTFVALQESIATARADVAAALAAVAEVEAV